MALSPRGAGPGIAAIQAAIQRLGGTKMVYWWLVPAIGTPDHFIAFIPVLCELLIHYIVTLIKLLKPGGVKVVMAETIAMK